MSYGYQQGNFSDQPSCHVGNAEDHKKKQYKALHIKLLSNITSQLKAELKMSAVPELTDALTKQLGKRHITIMLDEAMVRSHT